MHTTASDGMNAPMENVKMAKAAGLYGIAITDHDTVAGIAEAVRAGLELGVRIVPGVEISTVAGGQDIHILGYFIDVDNELLLSRLRQLRNTRDERNALMLERLCDIGISITMDEVLEQAGKLVPGDETIGRPHIAGVLVRKGYVESITEAFDRYLGKHGAAYVNPPRITPFDAIDWIHEAGGAAVVAHPGLYGDDTLVEQIVRYGADGIEAYHSDHTAEEEVRYAAIADKLGVLVTAGSDFHGVRNGHEFHAPIGSRRIGADVLEQLEARTFRV
jgi:3',5'-nucleoside bisphosphate phosphatase